MKGKRHEEEDDLLEVFFSEFLLKKSERRARESRDKHCEREKVVARTKRGEIELVYFAIFVLHFRCSEGRETGSRIRNARGKD